ncbi:MAG: SUMF1/EgtB/PvdO family nonheme iron enzyme [Myxococcales bacterium]|nr:SUMF1/EgtB/PvdO family nonheme iron enzyme [Myxococcales bacterium]
MGRAWMVVVGVAWTSACGRMSAEPMLDPMAMPWSAESGRCDAAATPESPLVIGWAAAERGSLERRLGQGLVVVRHHGCAIEVLRHCSVPGSTYRYGGFTGKREAVHMRSADDLWAKLPAGAAALEATLRRWGALTVTMRLVGMYEADRTAVRVDELAGDCGSATHVVTGMQVGAYALEAETAGGMGGGVTDRGTTVLGARSTTRRELLTHDGDPAACAIAKPGDVAPPEECGAPLRLELVPLGERRDAVTICPADHHWTGTACEAAATSSPAVGCPVGMTRVRGGGEDGGHVDDFCLDRNEVTVAAYTECVRAGACTPADDGAWWRDVDSDDRALATEACNGARADRAAHPINCVDFDQAQAYCRWRGADLPDDVQWAWAAGGGLQERAYPWGETPITADRANACGVECRAWFERHGRRRRMLAQRGDDGWPTTAEVGRFPAGVGRWGQLDLAGNVAEWTTGDAGRGRRRVRGGSFWDQRPGSLRTDDSGAALGDRRDPGIGLRCAAEPDALADPQAYDD